MRFDRDKARAQNAKVRHYFQHGFPLDKAGRQATMFAVLGVMSVEDAAAMAGVEPADLVREAEAWAAAAQ